MLVLTLSCSAQQPGTRSAPGVQTAAPPPRAVWKNLYDRAPTTGDSRRGGWGSAEKEIVSESESAAQPAITSDDFQGALPRTSPRARKRGHDQALKELADWDFLPTPGTGEKPNEFYFGKDDASEPPTPDEASLRTPTLQQQRMAMALCKYVQFNQAEYAEPCRMCQYLLDALLKNTISCRCYKSSLSSYNYQQCRAMRASLIQSLPRANAIMQDRSFNDVARTYQTCAALELCKE